MVKSCCVRNCKSNSRSPQKSVSFHKFPSGKTLLDIERRKLWTEAVAREVYYDYDNATICSRHFVKGKPAKFNERNEANWIPTLLLETVDSSLGKIVEKENETLPLSEINDTDEMIAFEGPHIRNCLESRDSPLGDTETQLHMEYSDVNEVDQLIFSSGCRIPEECNLFQDDNMLEDHDISVNKLEGVDAPIDNPSVQQEVDMSICMSTMLEEGFHPPQRIGDCGELSMNADRNNRMDELLKEWSEEWLDEVANGKVEDNDEVNMSICIGTAMDEGLHPPQRIGNCGELSIIVDHDNHMEELFEEWLDDVANDEVNVEVNEKYEKIIAAKQNEIEHLQNVIASQNLILSTSLLNLKSFEGNDKKTSHFTGLPNFKTLQIVYNFVQNKILTFSNILSKEQVFVMVLMRLRLNLCFTTLAYLFKVSLTTACKYFYSGLYSLYEQLRGFIKWPTKELLKVNMPLKFKKVFPDSEITSIIDCFEFFCEKPGTKDAVPKMFSNYKSHYTVKILISITPFGSVSFISKPYSGRTSDKFITETCGYMDYIEENDLILADRGFTVQKAILDKGASLRVPDSTNRKRQLSSVAIERTRALASIRNEVERLIGALRGKYAVLKGPIPITMLNHEHNGMNVFHMAVTVSCALINLCPSIII